MKNRIALIPARSGSKGLKDKNIKELKGKPLVAWTIEAARDSGLFSHIVLSTDSAAYGEIGMRFGAEVPYFRSDYLSGDKASSIEVVLDCLNFFSAREILFDTLCLLQPTSPLRTSTHIVESFRFFKEKGANSVISVCAMDHSPLWSNTLDESLSMEYFLDYENLKSRQSLPEYYRLNGALYWTKISALKRFRRFVSIPESYAYVMDKFSSVDIDDLFDFKMAELILDQCI